MIYQTQDNKVGNWVDLNENRKGKISIKLSRGTQKIHGCIIVLYRINDKSYKFNEIWLRIAKLLNSIISNIHKKNTFGNYKQIYKRKIRKDREMASWMEQFLNRIRNRVWAPESHVRAGVVATYYFSRNQSPGQPRQFTIVNQQDLNWMERSCLNQ